MFATNWTNDGYHTFVVVLVAMVSSVPREGRDVVVGSVGQVEAEASARAQWQLSLVAHQSDLHRTQRTNVILHASVWQLIPTYLSKQRDFSSVLLSDGRHTGNKAHSLSSLVVDEERMRPVLRVLFSALILLIEWQGRISGSQIHIKVKEASLYSAYCELLISRCSGMACVNQGSNSFTCHPRIYPQVEMSVDTLWLVLISCPAKGRSWHGWHGEIPRWFARLKTVTHTNICRSAQELNPWPWNCKSNALTTRLPSYTCHLYSLLRRFSSVTSGGIKLSGNQPNVC